MSDPVTIGGRPHGDSQSHDHEKRDRSYSFESGGTTVSVPAKGNDHASATDGYGVCGGNDVSH